MKVIGIKGNYREPSGEKPTVYLMSDSSLLKDGKPFFIPSFAERFTARPSLVVRISRLGKNISRKFAHRYYDAVTVGLNVTADGMKGDFENRNAGSLADAFDGAAILGEFMEIAADGADLSQMQFTASVNGAMMGGGKTAEMSVDVDGLIEYVSQYFTMKIGDILFTGNDWGECDFHIDDKVTGELDGKELLSFRVK